MDELFDIPESLSPKLKWMNKHKPRISYIDDGTGYPWRAWLGGEDDELEQLERHGPHTIAEGRTEDDALFQLAKLYQIEMWIGA